MLEGVYRQQGTVRAWQDVIKSRTLTSIFIFCLGIHQAKAQGFENNIKDFDQVLFKTEYKNLESRQNTVIP